MTYSEMYRRGVRALEAAGVPDAAADAALLLEHVSGLDRSGLFLYGDREMPEKEEERFLELTEKRAERIPLQHLTGKAYFMGLEFLSDGRTLVPRPDTETLVETALANVPAGARVLDLCTGSGCVAISLERLGSFAQVTAADVSADALAAAEENARLNGCRGIRFVKSDMFSAFAGERFGAITVNPPYIRDDVIKTLMPEVRDHDPYIALSGGEDGLVFYRILAAEAGEHLAPGGMLFMEIGHDQQEAVETLLREAGYEDVTTVRDLGGNPRVVFCKK